MHGENWGLICARTITNIGTEPPLIWSHRRPIALELLRESPAQWCLNVRPAGRAFRHQWGRFRCSRRAVRNVDCVSDPGVAGSHPGYSAKGPPHTDVTPCPPDWRPAPTLLSPGIHPLPGSRGSLIPQSPVNTYRFYSHILQTVMFQNLISSIGLNLTLSARRPSLDVRIWRL